MSTRCATIGSVGGDIVWRDKITEGVSQAALDNVFRLLTDSVRAAPLEVRSDAEVKLSSLKQESAKGKKADDVFARLVDGLVGLVPAAACAVVSAFATPLLAGIAGSATSVVLDKLKGKQSGVAPHVLCAQRYWI